MFWHQNITDAWCCKTSYAIKTDGLDYVKSQKILQMIRNDLKEELRVLKEYYVFIKAKNLLSNKKKKAKQAFRKTKGVSFGASIDRTEKLFLNCEMEGMDEFDESNNQQTTPKSKNSQQNNLYESLELIKENETKLLKVKDILKKEKFNAFEFNIERQIYKLGRFNFEKPFMEKYNEMYKEAEKQGIDTNENINRYLPPTPKNRYLVSESYSPGKENDFIYKNEFETPSREKTPCSTRNQYSGQKEYPSEKEISRIPTNSTVNLESSSRTRHFTFNENKSMFYFSNNRPKSQKPTNFNLSKNYITTKSKSYDIQHINEDLYRFSKINNSKQKRSKLTYVDLIHESDTSNLFKLKKRNINNKKINNFN